MCFKINNKIFIFVKFFAFFLPDPSSYYMCEFGTFYCIVSFKIKEQKIN